MRERGGEQGEKEGEGEVGRIKDKDITNRQKYNIVLKLLQSFIAVTLTCFLSMSKVVLNKECTRGLFEQSYSSSL